MGKESAEIGPDLMTETVEIGSDMKLEDAGIGADVKSEGARIRVGRCFIIRTERTGKSDILDL